MIEYLSQTMIGQWERCQVQFEFRWLREIVIPPGLAAHIGTGLHKGNEVNLRAKLVTGKDEPLSVVKDAARDGYVHALKDHGVFFPLEEKANAKVLMVDGIDVTVSLAETYHKDVAPKIQPKLIEQTIWMDSGLPYPFRGVIDILTRDHHWIDLKSSSKKWNQKRADASLQATLYRELVKAETGEYPLRLSFQVIVKNGEAQEIETSRTEDDFRVLVLRAKSMLRAIEAGVFHPADPESWICSPSYCGYWGLCPYIPSHKK